MQFEARFGRVNVTLKKILEWGANRLYKSSASQVVLNVPSWIMDSCSFEPLCQDIIIIIVGPETPLRSVLSKCVQ